MTKPHGSHLIIPRAAWPPLPSSCSTHRALHGVDLGTTPTPPHTHAKERSPWWGPNVGAGPGAHNMEGSVRLLACLVCILPMGEFPTLLSGPRWEQNRCSQNSRYSLLALNSVKLGLITQSLQACGGGRAALREAEVTEARSSRLGFALGSK